MIAEDIMPQGNIKEPQATGGVQSVAKNRKREWGQPKKSDKWIPWYFVAFFVGLALVNGVFVTIATSTHRGVVTDHAYQKGLDYNAVVQAVDAQAARGWQGEMTLDGDRFVFTLADNKEAPLAGAHVTAHFSRPAQAGYDFSVTLEETAAGQYSQTVSFPLHGQWDAKIAVLWNSQPYQQRKRIFVK